MSSATPALSAASPLQQPTLLMRIKPLHSHLHVSSTYLRTLLHSHASHCSSLPSECQAAHFSTIVTQIETSNLIHTEATLYQSSQAREMISQFYRDQSARIYSYSLLQKRTETPVSIGIHKWRRTFNVQTRLTGFK